MSLARSIGTINTSLSFKRSLSSDFHTGLSLWDRTMVSGDATIVICKTPRLHMRYETNTMTQHASAQQTVSSVLQIDTRVALWGDNLSLIPRMDFRRWTGTLPANFRSSARLALSAQIKVPRWLPGTSVMVNYAHNHSGAFGHPDQNHTDLITHWTIKRF